MGFMNPWRGCVLLVESQRPSFFCTAYSSNTLYVLRNRRLICDHLQLVCKHIISLPLQILCYLKGIGYFHLYLSALRCY